MRAKLMTSAAVLLGVLAFATMSEAQSFGGGGGGGHGGDPSKIDDSFNNNSKTHTDDSYNTKVDDSYNTKVDDSYNTDNSNHTKVDDSYNTDNSNHLKVDDSFNTKVDDSYNTDNSTTNWNVRVSLTNQDLGASVSHVKFDLSEDNKGNQNGRIRSGDISQSGGAFAGFAGIQTVSNNTGMASIGQAATAVSANANVTFGNGGGGN